MTISTGTCLRHFEVISSLGLGGMGEVFRARDTRLERDVAVKLLPAVFSNDESRRVRFEREAKTLAALSHAGIASIYDFFEHDDRLVLVMELVDGETLERVLSRGALPMGKALNVAFQMAEAIEHAHARGILHRDLKPANVKITRAGKVRLLDFGLARILDPNATEDDAPTMLREDSLTDRRTVLGTGPYMSPEQARGEPLDRRSDVFSFGSVTYEILTATRAFPGSAADALAAVLSREPAWDRLPRDTPVKVRDLLRRCLQKDRDRRLHDIADARIELEEASNEPSAAEAIPVQRRTWMAYVAATAFLLLSTLAIFVSWRMRAPGSAASSATARSTVSLSSDNSLIVEGGVAISADGQTLAFTARSLETQRLYARRLGEWEPRAIPGTEGAQNPFFSPDGMWVAFSRETALEKVPLRGGPPQLICKCAGVRGGANWGSDGSIIFGAWPNVGLWRVSADGGTPVMLTTPSERGGGVRYMSPERVPGNKAVLFTVWREGRASIAAFHFGSDKPTILVESGSHAHYLTTGHLLYVSERHVVAVPFDAQRLEIREGATVVIDDVREAPEAPFYGVSQTGTLVYLPDRSALNTLVWKDRRGAAIPLRLNPRRYRLPALSPDGRRFVATVQEGPARNVWIGSVEGEPLGRLTFGNDDTFGLWSPNDRRLFFTSGQNGRYNIFSASTDGSGKTERLTNSVHAQKATSWSPASNVLLFNDIDPSTKLDIWELFVDRKEARPLVKTPFREMEASFSPNGHWVAYQSDATGRYEVYVQAYPGTGESKQISVDGGIAPSWNPNGHELFYQTASAMMAVPVVNAQDFQVGAPVRLFSFTMAAAVDGKNYDVSPDGQRFLMIQKADAGVQSQLNLVNNWFYELQKIVPGFVR